MKSSSGQNVLSSPFFGAPCFYNKSTLDLNLHFKSTKQVFTDNYNTYKYINLVVKWILRIKCQNFTQYIEIMRFCVKLPKFCKKHTTLPKMIISSTWVTKSLWLCYEAFVNWNLTTFDLKISGVFFTHAKFSKILKEMPINVFLISISGLFEFE